MSSSIRLEEKFALIPDWIIDLDISSTAFKLYAVLARYADNYTHKAFPSRETLSERLKCSVKTVERAVAELQSAGAIRRESRGRYQSNIYTMVVHNPMGTKMSVGETKMSDEGTKMSRREDKNVALTITNELEPNNYINQFNDFWNEYPKKVDKRVAERSFAKALKRASFETIMEGLRRYKDDPNRKPEFTKNPSTWLNADAWENEAIVATAVNEWGKPLGKPAELPEARAWVRSLHNQGEHWECRVGEFGCK